MSANARDELVAAAIGLGIYAIGPHAENAARKVRKLVLRPAKAGDNLPLWNLLAPNVLLLRLLTKLYVLLQDIVYNDEQACCDAFGI